MGENADGIRILFSCAVIEYALRFGFDLLDLADGVE